jgi:hypothetical protein
MFAYGVYWQTGRPLEEIFGMSLTQVYCLSRFLEKKAAIEDEAMRNAKAKAMRVK